MSEPLIPGPIISTRFGGSLTSGGDVQVPGGGETPPPLTPPLKGWGGPSFGGGVGAVIVPSLGAPTDPFIFTDIPQNILDRYPQFMNPLLPTYYRFSIDRLPFVTYFCQSASIPNVTVSEVVIPTPFMSVKRPSKMDFDDLNVTFVVDENVENWLEIFKWMRSTTAVDGFSEIKPDYTHVSTANIIILNSAKRPKLNVTFTDVFPKTLSSLDFNSALVDPEPFVASCSFSYRSYSVETL